MAQWPLRIRTLDWGKCRGACRATGSVRIRRGIDQGVVTRRHISESARSLALRLMRLEEK